MKKKTIITTLLVGLATTSLYGCGSTEASSDSGDVTTIFISTSDQMDGYAYLDENGEFTGYDLEILKAVDEKLPQYSFEFFASTDPLAALQTGKAEISACQWEYSDERAATYLYSDVPYGSYDTYITIDVNRDDIQSIEDLAGKIVQEYLGGNAATVLEAFNDEHADNPIDLILINTVPTLEERIASIQSGKWDAFCITPRDCATYNEQAGEEVFKQVGDPVTESRTYFIFAKDQEELKAAVDGALAELREEGKFSELSIQFLGGDYSGSSD